MAFSRSLQLSFSICVLGFASLGHFQAFADQASTMLPAHPNFSQVENWIQTQNIKSVEDLLNSFSKADLSNFALVYASRSSQGATPDNPRTIVFNTNSNLTFAFNGSNLEQGYDRMEFMQFQTDTKKFELHEVTFTGGQAQISAPNPAACLQCHTTNPHPIWDTYFFWPGVYGSEDAQVVGAEEANLSSWYMNRQKNSRYAALHDYTTAADAFGTRSPEGHPINLGAQSLGMVLSGQNFQAIAKNFSDDPKLSPFRYAFLAAGICTSEPFLDFIPTNAQNAAVKSYASLSAEVAQGLQTSYLQRFERSEQVNGVGQHATRVKSVVANLKNNQPDPSVDGYTQITNYRYVVENFGDVTPNWSLEFVEPGSNRKTYAMNDGFVLIPGIANLWSTTLSPITDADLYAIFSTAPKYPYKVDESKVCGKLKDKSLAALAGLQWVRKTETATGANSSSPNPAGVFKSCVGCHGSGAEGIPALPFADPEKLKTKLSETGYAHGTLADEISFRISSTGSEKMPPDRALPTNELQSIKDFLTDRRPAGKFSPPTFRQRIVNTKVLKPW